MNKAGISDSERRGRARRGMSLIEVVVAVAILSIVVGGVAWMVIMVRNVSDQARDHYIAANIAKNHIERARIIEYDVLEDFEAADVVVDEGGTPDSSGRFRMTTSVSQVNSNLKEVAVSVEIRNRVTVDFEGEEEQMSTFLSKFTEIE